RERTVRGERREEVLLVRVCVGIEQREEAEEAARVGLERRRGEEEEMARRARERRDRAVRLVVLEPVRLVDDEEVDPRLRSARGEARVFRQLLERDHALEVSLERVEAGPVLLHHVLPALPVEEREGLMELPPELAEPLHRERR